MTPAAGSSPLLSVVIPVYNRAALVHRSLESCLRQDYDRFEVVVVDDGSTDGSADAVRQHADPRIRLFSQAKNQGQCPARNLGAREARGDWLVFLDSDDELVPGALGRIAHHAAAAGPQVGKLLLACRWSTGQLSPDPMFDGRVMDYEGFLRWLESVFGRPSECLPCTRRSAFLQVPYPEGHSAEGIHELDFAARFAVQGVPEVVRLFHRDAGNSFHVIAAPRLLQLAPFYAADAVNAIARHGDAMARLAPRRFRETLGSAALYSFAAGRRGDGVRYAARYLRSRPGSLSGWGILGLGLLGPRVLARAHEFAHRRTGGRPVRVRAVSGLDTGAA
jgi:glycosyltransferase involved in cell wall biosynthesis